MSHITLTFNSQDPKLWSHPDQFRPEHFLNNGALQEDKPGFLPYGVGKRMCPGSKLADIQALDCNVSTLN